MTRKTTILLLIALMLSVLSLSVAETDLSSVSYSEAETRAMSNFMNRNRYVTVGNRIYGQAWDNKLFCAEVTVSGGKAVLKNSKVLMRNAQADYFCEHEGAVYCYLKEELQQQASVLRIDCATDEVTAVYQGTLNYLQGLPDGLYFTDEDSMYCRMDYTGEGKTVLIDRPVFHPYQIGNGLLIYQDDSDGEKLHLMNLASGEDYPLSDRRGFRSVLCGNTLYYCSALGGKSEYCLSRVELSTQTNEHTGYRIGSSFFIDGEEIWFADDSHMSLNQAWNMGRDVEDYQVTGLSYLYSNGEFYVRYGWKQKNAALVVSRMLILPCGQTKNATELKVK